MPAAASSARKRARPPRRAAKPAATSSSAGGNLGRRAPRRVPGERVGRVVADDGDRHGRCRERDRPGDATRYDHGAIGPDQQSSPLQRSAASPRRACRRRRGLPRAAARRAPRRGPRARAARAARARRRPRRRRRPRAPQPGRGRSTRSPSRARDAPAYLATFARRLRADEVRDQLLRGREAAAGHLDLDRDGRPARPARSSAGPRPPSVSERGWTPWANSCSCTRVVAISSLRRAEGSPAPRRPRSAASRSRRVATSASRASGPSPS